MWLHVPDRRPRPARWNSGVVPGRGRSDRSGANGGQKPGEISPHASAIGFHLLPLDPSRRRIWVHRDDASRSLSGSKSSAEQNATRRFRCTTRPSASNAPGPRRAHELDSAGPPSGSSRPRSSTDQHAPPIAVSSSVVTIPPWTMKPPVPSWKQYSGAASHSITDRPSPCSIPRYASVRQMCGAQAPRRPRRGATSRLNAVPGFAGSGTAHAVRLNDPRATGLLVVQHAQCRLGDERRLHQRHGENAAQLVRDDRRVGEAGAERVDRESRASRPAARAAHEADTACFVAVYIGSMRHAGQPRERRGADDRPAVRHQPPRHSRAP